MTYTSPPDGPHAFEVRSREGLEACYLDPKAARGYVAELRQVGVNAWIVPVRRGRDRTSVDS